MKDGRKVTDRPVGLDQLLSPKKMHEFHSFGTTWRILWGSDSKRYAAYTEEERGLRQFRDKLEIAIRAEDRERPTAAQDWASFLTSMAMSLEAWSTFTVAIIAILGVGSSLLTLSLSESL